MPTDARFDVGPFRTRAVVQPHEGRVYVERTQPNERLILAGNAEMRKLTQKKSALGRYTARIPEIAMPYIAQRWPDFLHGDGPQRIRALMEILKAHPEWAVVPKDQIHAK